MNRAENLGWIYTYLLVDKGVITVLEVDWRATDYPQVVALHKILQ